MTNVASVVFIGAIAAAALLAPPQPRTITAATTPATDRHRRHLDDVRHDRRAVSAVRGAARQRKSGLRAAAEEARGPEPEGGVGINLILRGKILSWAVDGDESGGYVLFADWNSETAISPTRRRFVSSASTASPRCVSPARARRDSDLSRLDEAGPRWFYHREASASWRCSTTSDDPSGSSSPTAANRRVRLTGSAGFTRSPSIRSHQSERDAPSTPTRSLPRVRTIRQRRDTSYESTSTRMRSLTLTPLPAPRTRDPHRRAPAPDFASHRSRRHSRSCPSFAQVVC